MNLTQNAFTETRQPGDIDLVSEITNLLKVAGHSNPYKWQDHPTVMEALGAHPKLQRFLINRYWRIQLSNLAVSTTRERYCLIDTGEYTDYLKIFNDAIIPTIIKNNI